MKLLALKINDILVTDISFITEEMLNGKLPYLYQEEIPENYIDITSIENWHKYGKNVGDFMFIKYRIKELLDEKLWVNLTDSEKLICIDYYNYEPSKAIYFLLTSGICTSNNVKEYLLIKWQTYHNNVLECCKERWEKGKFIASAYLSYYDSEDLYENARSLIHSYTEIGRFGLNYGDNLDGIMDFIESTNSYQSTGLSSKQYTYNNITENDFIQLVKNCLVYGI